MSVQRNSTILTICGLSFAAALALAWISASPTQASASARETLLKAEFVYRFASMTKWPETALPSSDEPFRIGVIGDDEFARALESAVEGKRLDDRSIQIEVLAGTPSKPCCQVVYLASGRANELQELLKLSRSGHVLTVSDDSRFVDRGGMIQIDRDGNRLRFSINRGSATDSNLAISSKLLRLASRVVDTDGT